MSSTKRIGIVYTKDALRPPVTMDLIRWHALARGLVNLGHFVDMITVEGQTPKRVSASFHVVPVREAQWDKYDIVKGCYQPSIRYIPSDCLKLVRLARVVGPEDTSRDSRHHDELLRCQDLVARNAHGIVVNDEINRRRWLDAYGNSLPVHLLPTGCAKAIPRRGPSPFISGKRIAIFAGSISSKRMAKMLNLIGQHLKEAGWSLAILGENKTSYYCSKRYKLNPDCCELHGPVPVEESWNYLLNASVGIALSPGPLVFENEISKLYSYLRAGLPTICEDRISNAALVTGLGWGRTFEYGDALAAVKAVVELGMKDLFETQRKEIVETIVKNHSWEARARLLDGILESLCASKKRP